MFYIVTIGVQSNNRKYAPRLLPLSNNTQTMTNQKTFFLLGAVTALAVLSVAGFQISDIVAEEKEKTGHKFAEGTDVTALFHFKDAQELGTFEVFNQESGWDADDAAVFELQGIVGDTPMLYDAADVARKYSRNGISMNFDNKFFNVDVILAQGGDVKRVFTYADCRIADYEVNTLFDKEEGWMGKGFAVIDKYEFACDGYSQKNPIYEKMNEKPKANTMSTLDLKEPFYTWSDHFKYKNQNP